MKLFSSSALLTAVLAASLASCSSLGGLGDAMGGMTGGGGSGALDMAMSSPAMNMMTLPPAPAVGQSWTMDMSGMKTTTAIVAEVDGQFILEQETAMYGDPVILAYQVDPSVDMTKVVATGEKMNANVTAAWVGVAGEKPKEHTVMDAMVMPEMPDMDPVQTNTTTGTETVSLGGRDWDAQWSETDGNRSWMVGSFMLRSDFNGDTVMQVTDWKTDAKPALDWSAGE